MSAEGSAGRSKKVPWRDVHGILLLDKPQGLSSNQALQSVRHLYRAAKAGHTGSLDPLATGLLPICFGEATKIAGLLLGAHKAYETTCRLGATTDTDDADGTVLVERKVPVLDAARIESALAKLTGRITQVPPAYSAIKQAGVPLYRKARRGEEVVAPPREVEIARFELLELTPTHLRLHIECGSGTYVRSLVRDLGEALGCGAHVESLRRLWVAPFTAPQMTDIATLRGLAESDPAALDALLLPLENGLSAWPQVQVSENDAIRLRHGQKIATSADEGRCVAVDAAGRALALAECGPDGRLRSIRGINSTVNPSTPTEKQG
ncbi:MAG: tRNA pseudouridine(55) synthase TruB [Dokdonella sp.]